MQNLLRTTSLSALLSLTLAAPIFAADPGLTILEWTGYDDEVLFAPYAALHGDAPTYEFFLNEDDWAGVDMLAAGSAADAAHPCAQTVGAYREAGLIEPWDIDRIPSYYDLDPNLLNSELLQDDDGVWFLPVDWGVTALAYNSNAVPLDDASTLDIFINPAYRGKIALSASTEDLWALAFLANGVTDWNEAREGDIKRAAAWLKRAHANAPLYWTDAEDLAARMKTEEILVAWAWNDLPVALRAEGFPVVFDRDLAGGSSTWYCGYVNVRNGKPDEDKLYDFINGVLDPDSGPGLVETFGYGHANTLAMAQLNPQSVWDAGLNSDGGPVLPQTPKSPELSARLEAELAAIMPGS